MYHTYPLHRTPLTCQCKSTPRESHVQFDIHVVFVACLKYVLRVCQAHRRSLQIYTSCFSTPPPFAPCDCCAPGRKGRKSCCLKASNFNTNFQAKKQWKVMWSLSLLEVASCFPTAKSPHPGSQATPQRSNHSGPKSTKVLPMFGHRKSAMLGWTLGNLQSLSFKRVYMRYI